MIECEDMTAGPYSDGKTKMHISNLTAGVRRHMTPGRLTVLSVLALAAGSMTWAGIPQPDAALYGNVLITGLPVNSSSDIKVVARVDGVARPVSAYQMGESTFAGEGYILKLRLEAAAPGSPVRDDAATVGQTARLLVKRGSDPESLVAMYPISTIGTLERLDLNLIVAEPVNCVADGRTNAADHGAFNGCMGGPTVDVIKACECADVDRSNTVDLRDWAWLQSGFSPG